jgi:hypothetical protein
VHPLQSSLDVGVSRVNYLSNHVAQSTKQLVSTNFSESMTRRASFRSPSSKVESSTLEGSSLNFRRHSLTAASDDSQLNMSRISSTLSMSYDMDGIADASEDDCIIELQEESHQASIFPDQDIDFEGPNNGKKITDDLAEIKDKMHEMTWHLFDDHAYVIKNSNTVYFGDGKKSEKKRKSDVKKQLDKYLGLGQYSYSNPFVARVGMYVEPIIGSAYSFLCLFRAGFNVVTWRDPMLTFWVSLFSGMLVIVLFVFPWRIFLACLGMFLVGPQNLVIRIMQEHGHLPPAPEYQAQNNNSVFTEEISELPNDAPIFTAEDRRPGNETYRNLKPLVDDPTEIHHVPVPHSPLLYQRCYDWPPEAQYALVSREISTDEKRRGGKSDLSKNSVNMTQAKSNRLGIRNRFSSYPSEINIVPGSRRPSTASTITGKWK